MPGYQPPGAPIDGPVAPIISPSGFGGLGNSRSEPEIRREHLWENIGNVSWERGRHNFKFGVDTLHHLISETDSPPGQSPFGRFNFDSNFSNNPASTTGTGNAMASFLLGYPASTVRDLFLPGTAHVFANEYNFYDGAVSANSAFTPYQMQVNVSAATPEPPTWSMRAFGIGAAFFMTRRRDSVRVD